VSKQPQGVLSLDLVKVNPEGWPFIGRFSRVTLILFFVWEPLGWLGVRAPRWGFFFCRDPARARPERDGRRGAPAAGIATQTVAAAPPRELGMGDEPRPRISIFLNVFDVHVNRMPADGRVVKRAYRPGKFINASFDKASEENERLSLRLRLDRPGVPEPVDIAVVQIAGLVARRIRCWVAEGDVVLAGQRYGMIRFGSRMEVCLPPEWKVLVKPGQKVFAGESSLAQMN